MTHDEFNGILAGLADAETMETAAVELKDKVTAMIDETSATAAKFEEQAKEIKTLRAKLFLRSSNPAQDVLDEQNNTPDPAQRLIEEMREEVTKLAQRF